jgi:hypothetical protein
MSVGGGAADAEFADSSTDSTKPMTCRLLSTGQFSVTFTLKGRARGLVQLAKYVAQLLLRKGYGQVHWTRTNASAAGSASGAGGTGRRWLGHGGPGGAGGGRWMASGVAAGKLASSLEAPSLELNSDESFTWVCVPGGKPAKEVMAIFLSYFQQSLTPTRLVLRCEELCGGSGEVPAGMLAFCQVASAAAHGGLAFVRPGTPLVEITSSTPSVRNGPPHPSCTDCLCLLTSGWHRVHCQATACQPIVAVLLLQGAKKGRSPHLPRCSLGLSRTISGSGPLAQVPQYVQAQLQPALDVFQRTLSEKGVLVSAPLRFDVAGECMMREALPKLG